MLYALTNWHPNPHWYPEISGISWGAKMSDFPPLWGGGAYDNNVQRDISSVGKRLLWTPTSKGKTTIPILSKSSFRFCNEFHMVVHALSKIVLSSTEYVEIYIGNKTKLNFVSPAFQSNVRQHIILQLCLSGSVKANLEIVSWIKSFEWLEMFFSSCVSSLVGLLTK